MNRRTLQRIILEELSSTRPTRRPPRRLGLVDYLGEGSERNLLELSDDAVISTGRSLREVDGYDNFVAAQAEIERLEDEAARKAAEAEAAAKNDPAKDKPAKDKPEVNASAAAPAPQPSAPVAPPGAAVATAAGRAAEPGARPDADTDTRQDAEERAREDADERWAEEAARRNAAEDASSAPTEVYSDDSTGPGDDPEPDEDAPPTINTRAAIDAIDRMAAPEPTTTPTTGSVSERRRPSLIDLLYT